MGACISIWMGVVPESPFNGYVCCS